MCSKYQCVCKLFYTILYKLSCSLCHVFVFEVGYFYFVICIAHSLGLLFEYNIFITITKIMEPVKCADCLSAVLRLVTQ